MILKRRKPKIKDIQKSMLEELIEIKEILKETQLENKSLNWIILSLEADIKKLKEKNRNLKNQLKKEEGKENELN